MKRNSATAQQCKSHPVGETGETAARSSGSGRSDSSSSNNSRAAPACAHLAVPHCRITMRKSKQHGAQLARARRRSNTCAVNVELDLAQHVATLALRAGKQAAVRLRRPRHRDELAACTRHKMPPHSATLLGRYAAPCVAQQRWKSGAPLQRSLTQHGLPERALVRQRHAPLLTPPLRVRDAWALARAPAEQRTEHRHGAEPARRAGALGHPQSLPQWSTLHSAISAVAVS